MNNRYLRIDPDAIQPDADALWAALLAAKEAFTTALAEDRDEDVTPLLGELQARILALLACPARSSEQLRRKRSGLEFVTCYQDWFPTRAAPMARIAIQLDLADLGLTLADLDLDRADPEQTTTRQ